MRTEQGKFITPDESLDFKIIVAYSIPRWYLKPIFSRLLSLYYMHRITPFKGLSGAR